MVRNSQRIAASEIGQRALRSTSVYLPKGGVKEGAFCRTCGAVYRNKRWSMAVGATQGVRGEAGATALTCPACHRMADNIPAGIVTLKGGYLLDHEDEILNVITHAEALSRGKNPLVRIMEINQEGDVLTIATTEDKLAQKLGREVHRAHKGEIRFRWSPDEKMVRVTWTR